MIDDEIPPDIALVIAEANRIHGSGESSPSKQFWLLPFARPTEMLEFLRTVPTGSGDAGIRDALERQLGVPLPDFPPRDSAPGA